VLLGYFVAKHASLVVLSTSHKFRSLPGSGWRCFFLARAAEFRRGRRRSSRRQRRQSALRRTPGRQWYEPFFRRRVHPFLVGYNVWQ
jgi:hypothetical protein